MARLGSANIWLSTTYIPKGEQEIGQVAALYPMCHSRTGEQRCGQSLPFGWIQQSFFSATEINFLPTTKLACNAGNALAAPGSRQLASQQTGSPKGQKPSLSVKSVLGSGFSLVFTYLSLHQCYEGLQDSSGKHVLWLLDEYEEEATG